MKPTAILVEHFFRHEYGRIVALLTRSLGARHLDLIEDVVQSALSRALIAWPRSGPPDDPSGWLYRTAKNLAIDALRRERTAARLWSKVSMASETAIEAAEITVDFADEVGDEPLRLLFLCCHPAIPPESRVALALKTVSGFSTREIAIGLLTTTANVEKRLSRAKERLRETGLELIETNPQMVLERLESVLSTIYLIFNEGFAASHGEQVVRRDLCDEAIRQARMLAHHGLGQSPATWALLGLFLMHVARLDTRVDSQGAIVLLGAQDRSQWNWELVKEAMHWMQLSATGDELSRYHIEASIAWEHCRVGNLEQTDWNQVTRLYEMLVERFATPMIRLNHAIALSYAANVDAGLAGLFAIRTEDRQCLRPWWDCALAQLYQRQLNSRRALFHWRDALALATNGGQRTFIQSQIIRWENNAAIDDDQRHDSGPTRVE